MPNLLQYWGGESRTHELGCKGIACTEKITEYTNTNGFRPFLLPLSPYLNMQRSWRLFSG